MQLDVYGKPITNSSKQKALDEAKRKEREAQQKAIAEADAPSKYTPTQIAQFQAQKNQAQTDINVADSKKKAQAWDANQKRFAEEDINPIPIPTHNPILPVAPSKVPTVPKNYIPNYENLASGSGGGAAGGKATGGSSYITPGLTLTGMKDYVSQYDKALTGASPNAGNYSYDKLKGMNMSTLDPTLQNASDLAKMYGLDYDYNNIYSTLMSGVNKGYEAQYAQQDVMEDKYYDQAGTAQNTLMDTLDKQRSQAIMTGTNKGMQAANALSAMLGVSKNFADNATSLAQARAQLAKEQGADIAGASKTAMDTYNQMGQQLADVSKNLYSSDTSRYVAGLDYNATVAASNAQMAAQKMAAQSQYDSTVANNITAIMNQYYSGQISLEQAQMAANAQIESAKSSGAGAAAANGMYGVQIAEINRAASNYAADMGYYGNMYNANKNNQASTYATDAQLQAANAGNAASVQTMATQAVQGLINGVGDNSYTPAEAINYAATYKSLGIIDQATYEYVVKMFS